MSTMTTMKELAAEAAPCFETATRPDGETFTKIKDGSPEWVTELVYKAHGDFLPDDWRSAAIRDALEFIADADDPEDVSAEFADAQVDVYTGRRFAWLSSNLQRQGYVDEGVDNLGAPEPFSVADAIGLGQYEEAGEIYSLVLQALEDLSA